MDNNVIVKTNSGLTFKIDIETGDFTVEGIVSDSEETMTYMKDIKILWDENGEFDGISIL